MEARVCVNKRPKVQITRLLIAIILLQTDLKHSYNKKAHWNFANI